MIQHFSCWKYSPIFATASAQWSRVCSTDV